MKRRQRGEAEQKVRGLTFLFWAATVAVIVYTLLFFTVEIEGSFYYICTLAAVVLGSFSVAIAIPDGIYLREQLGCQTSYLTLATLVLLGVILFYFQDVAAFEQCFQVLEKMAFLLIFIVLAVSSYFARKALAKGL